MLWTIGQFCFKFFTAYLKEHRRSTNLSFQYRQWSNSRSPRISWNSTDYKFRQHRPNLAKPYLSFVITEWLSCSKTVIASKGVYFRISKRKLCNSSEVNKNITPEKNETGTDPAHILQYLNEHLLGGGLLSETTLGIKAVHAILRKLQYVKRIYRTSGTRIFVCDWALISDYGYKFERSTFM